MGFSGGFSFYNKRFKKLNTKIVFANDFDKDAATCYNSNPLLVNDGAKCLLEDIRNVMPYPSLISTFCWLDFHVNHFQMQGTEKELMTKTEGEHFSKSVNAY